jgi:hypothetical protein
MAKRPSILDDVLVAPAAATPLAPATAPRAAKPNVQHTSVYIPREAYERLREIAFHERKKIHDLLMEGLDKVIADRGHAERATKSSKV